MKLPQIQRIGWKKNLFFVKIWFQFYVHFEKCFLFGGHCNFKIYKSYDILFSAYEIFRDTRTRKNLRRSVVLILVDFLKNNIKYWLV